MFTGIGEDPQWLEKTFSKDWYNIWLKVQYRELQAHQLLFFLWEKHGGSPLGARNCIDVGAGDWELSA